MAFKNLMLTTNGRILYAKAQQGKPFHILRVGIGDGLLGSGSMVNRNALISEKMSLLIDAVQLSNNAQEASVVATFTNKDLTEGFYFREIGIFAQEPDTRQETLYLYDNAGTDGEFIPEGSGGVSVNERLKLLVTLADTPDVTFQWSGNPLYLSLEDLISYLQNYVHVSEKGKPGGVATLGTDGKLTDGQVPVVSLTEVSGILAVDHGGTGADNAAGARANLGAAPVSHTHPWGQVTGQPGSYPPSSHTHPWNQITGQPGSYPPSAHTHPWNQITGQPGTYPPSSHTHPWNQITGQPSSYPPSAHNHSAANITSGTLPVARGGTGQTSVQALRNSMGLGNTTGVLPVANGGTGASTAAAARTNLGAAAVGHTHTAAQVGAYTTAQTDAQIKSALKKSSSSLPITFEKLLSGRVI